jgi:hypothetical protein
LCYVDSFELRNPLLRKAANRVWLEVLPLKHGRACWCRDGSLALRQGLASQWRPSGGVIKAPHGAWIGNGHVLSDEEKREQRLS